MGDERAEIAERHRVRDQADALEHVLSEDLEARIAAKLGNPTHDPHGDPIPTADGEIDETPTRALADLEPGSTGVFVRVSEIAGKVLRHDAMSLPIFTDDREHVIPYATTFPDGVLPPIIPLPESQKRLVTEPWDSHIADDIHLHPDGVNTPMARAGMHALLRVPIRLEGELVGWARTFAKSNRFFSYDPRFPSDSKRRRAAIGRPVTD